MVEEINIAAKIVKNGGIIAYPTDTVYGLGCDPKNERSVERLFEIKRRENKAIPILFDSEENIEKFVYLTEQEREIGRRFWPGALTIISKIKENVNLPSLIHQNSGYIGVRIPKSEIALELIEKCGGCITGTSANISGEASSRNILQVKKALGDKIDYIVDGGELKAKESTIIKIENNKVIFLREGELKNQIDEYFNSV
ncbi:MAG: L-threonylcarbamoyladenylate synthase [Candidatus Marsarchaeota archaeon]|nr:L-threonylcarbamoyladenylate synthase [Candidatus Marsarchaeota archaeon]